MVTKKLSAAARLQETLLIAATLFSLYTALALFSFDARDPSWLHAVQSKTAYNVAGPIGAWLADTLFFAFGLLAYVIPLIVLSFTMISLYRQREGLPNPRLLWVLRFTGAVVLLLTTCGLATILVAGMAHFPAGAGGLLGSLLIQGMLPWYSRLGTLLILLCCWAIGFTLLTGCSWLALIQWSGERLHRLLRSSSGWRGWLGTVYSLLKAKRAAAQPQIPQVEPRLSEESVLLPALLDSHQDSLPRCRQVLERRAEVSETIKPLDPVEDLALKEGNASQLSRTPTRPVPMPPSALPSIERVHRMLPPLPALDLLTLPPQEAPPIEGQQADLQQIAQVIEARLADYRVSAEVVGISPGPVITRYELRLAPGIKAARISTLARDLARSLSVVAVRVVEVIPGKPYVGLELPNKQRQTVYLREVLDSNAFKQASSPLSMVLGKDISGHPLVADLAKMPHLLVAGTTGSGKSVGVNAMILSMLYKATPDEVRFIMIDPKMLELSVYEGIPHLLTEVVTDMKDAANALRWCVNEMERRYKLMSLLGVRHIGGYNERIQQAEQQAEPIIDPLWRRSERVEGEPPYLEKLPYIVVLVDEFADLMMTVGKKVEELIARLAQKARAAGIHLVLATQRPSVDVITGLIKANIPTRIAFTVSSKIDSRTILDQTGAESLLGMGDMLYLPPNASLPLRAHGAFVHDQEVHAVVRDWKARGRPQYIETILSDLESREGTINSFESSDQALDPLFDQAVAFVAESRRGSISSVQRKFKIGYNRAARLIEQMEAERIVSPPGHNGNREVLLPPLKESVDG
jgi:DNA segregation ATPase FtsK/SpoIIIE, S-DNA-T family